MTPEYEQEIAANLERAELITNDTNGRIARMPAVSYQPSALRSLRPCVSWF